MQDVIRRIIKIEEKAQAIIEGANREKEQKKRDFDDRLESLEKRIIGDAKRKVSQIRERELSENVVARDSQQEKCNGKLEMMEQRVKENEAKWVDELVANVLKR